ncbi:phenazine biosynthesis protein PhzF [Afipia sp. P52-10]|uniref:PhzF family phenazine biosynthesis protein n=1 Tax=Afipia sp. P52-10 TaxID=1429916 RepID=UPI0003DEF583|nr:PhzF family phenazine biosynthesis protein [Afipia sp. P52-10]ETR77961.1 phenazine biosynthesis protein PhzF [Afipia sp. P52-10]
MTSFAFQQVDVFTTVALKGNPLAVVIGADGLSDAAMAALANWTNLSETAFLLRPTASGADYRVRIFTPERELLFAGHPTLGSCQVWLNAGGKPKGADIVQECGVGLVRIKRDGEQLAFAAPPLRRTGDVERETLDVIAKGLGIQPQAIIASQWIDNGPGWVAVMLGSRAEVLAIKPDYPALKGLKLGVVAPWDVAKDGCEAQFEVRAFVSTLADEDPVTGSLNAGIAQWLIGRGIAPAAYVASQGTALGRGGRVHVQRDGDDIWIGGSVVTCIEGTLRL